MKNFTKVLVKTFQLCLVILVFSTCKKTSVPVALESNKSLVGNWKIIKVLQNSTDITTQLDISKFTVKFTADSYVLENQQVPFIVAKNGKWAFNDPSYPFTVSFNQDGSSTAVKSDLFFPIVGDGRQLTITFNAGCEKNIYQYTLAKF